MNCDLPKLNSTGLYALDQVTDFRIIRWQGTGWIETVESISFTASWNSSKIAQQTQKREEPPNR